jgi:hypothetical protein
MPEYKRSHCIMYVPISIHWEIAVPSLPVISPTKGGNPYWFQMDFPTGTAFAQTSTAPQIPILVRWSNLPQGVSL